VEFSTETGWVIFLGTCLFTWDICYNFSPNYMKITSRIDLVAAKRQTRDLRGQKTENIGFSIRQKTDKKSAIRHLALDDWRVKVNR
jgi:hypothetical protein